MSDPMPHLPQPVDATRRDAHLSEELEAALPRLRAFARNLAAPRGDGDDIVQETLTRAWRYRDSWDPEQQVVPWLVRTAFRVAVDLRRKAARTPHAVEDHDHPTETPCRAELLDEVEHALRNLSEIERTLLLEFHRDGISIEHLAARHAMPANTVKSHLRRARGKLSGGSDAS